jgi:hypothetical protein
VVARSIPCKIFITPDSFEANDPSEKEQIITPAVPLSYDQRGAKSPAPHEPLDGCAPRSKLLIQQFLQTTTRSAQLHFSNHPPVSGLEGRSVPEARVSHFASVLLLLANLMLTLCFGLAAWRVSDEGTLVNP